MGKIKCFSTNLIKMRDHGLLSFSRLNIVIKIVVLLADFRILAPLSGDYEEFYLLE
jgi:hypothetical protein